MSKIKSFEDLKVWQDARELNKKMFQILKGKDDKNTGFLINHLFKTSGSIMDNIAEGFERNGNKEFKQFLSISKGSAGELSSQLYRALDAAIINQEEFKELTDITKSIGNQLGSFMSYLKTTSYKGGKF
ncbi:four helix bundle protein [Psychroflexus sp. CAK1W]|uniref:four helix bundle protein n=1 Tax=Psychroflexus curvus TaxID=2873595 RepID=UPI001CCAE023|nr:four helix bundle protein [Psychroflexus curvus]MBZ9629091.1 four helix bundle protein [Psychroflexus curvus]